MAHLPTVLALIDDGGADLAHVKFVVVTGAPTDVGYSGRVKVVFYDDLIAAPPSGSAPDSTDLDAWCWMLYTSAPPAGRKGCTLPSAAACGWSARAGCRSPA